MSYVRRPRGEFVYRGDRYAYHFSRNGRTWMTERAVELPIFHRLVRAAGDARVLEVGRTLFGYFDDLRHTVVDKYDHHADVEQIDVVDYDSGHPFDLIVSVSTLEHVGWDEAPRDPGKALRAVAHLTSLLAPEGELFFDWPVGVHPGLDRAAETGELPLVACMRRVRHGNRWVEADWSEVGGLPYDRMIGRANAVAFARIKAGP